MTKLHTKETSMGLFSKLFGRKKALSEDQLAIDRAEKGGELINKSLLMANESTSFDEKLSQISIAQDKLEEMKELASQYPFIQLEQLNEVEDLISELICETNLINPRKVELRDLAKEIGSTIQNCPYCEISLAKFPQRKTKCKSCNKFIYARKEPLSGEKRLFREDELALYDEIKELSIGSWDWWNEKREKIAKAKEELAQEWQVEPSSITDGDANWRIINSESIRFFASKNWPEYLALKEEAIRQLLSENKRDHALRFIPECIYLTYAAPNELDLSGLAEYDLMGNEKKTYSPLASLYKNVAGDLNTIKISFQEFSITSDLPNMFDLSVKDVWALFERDFEKYLSSVEK